MESGIDVGRMDRFFKLMSSVVTLVANGRRSIAKVCDALQKIVNERGFELYRFGRQKTGGYETGFAIERHLVETGLIDRCLSLEDEIVKVWRADPATYPEEFKDKGVVLWKSIRTSGDYRHVACLVWRGERVVVLWTWLEFVFYGYDPAVLASSLPLVP